MTTEVWAVRWFFECDMRTRTVMHPGVIERRWGWQSVYIPLLKLLLDRLFASGARRIHGIQIWL